MTVSLAKRIRDLQAVPQAIPGPAAIFYNATAAKLLRKPEAKIAADVAGQLHSGTFLDLGAGTGFLAIEVAKRLPDAQVRGIDLSRQMVKIARRHGRAVENVRFELADVVDLPFEDESIDFIFSTGSLHHWKNPAQAFAEAYRVLRSGGDAWIYDVCPEAVAAGAETMRREYGVWVYRLLSWVSHFHGFTREEYETRAAGILDETKFRDSYQMALTDIWMKIVLEKG